MELYDFIMTSGVVKLKSYWFYNHISVILEEKPQICMGTQTLEWVCIY